LNRLRATTDGARTSPPGALAADASWNLGAFALMAITGVAISFFVLSQRGGEALGVFSQVYAIYVVVAQVAALGIHDSAQKHAAEHSEDPIEVRRLCRGACTSALVTAALVAATLGLASPLVGIATDSSAVGRGVLVVAPGVWLFGMNKALLGVLNGLRRMRTFALAQAARAVTILGAVVGIGLSALPDWALVGAFVAGELVVLCGLTAALWPELRGPWDGGTARWCRRHLRFGVRALPAGLLAESFVRIDVIVLGVFVSDVEVGTYGFAAFFAEGLIQIPVVVRTVVNPVFVKLLARRDHAAVARLSRRAGAASVAMTGLGGAVVLTLLPLLGPRLGVDLVTSAGELLGILLVGICFYAVFLPSDYLLLQAGLPGRQSALMAVNVLVSVLLNALLIGTCGARGAALATASAYGWSALALTLATARWLGMTRTLFMAPLARKARTTTATR
jgi:O-antigen/teichoic acid export membrane protein